jgi:hypothetical protein
MIFLSSQASLSSKKSKKSKKLEDLESRNRGTIFTIVIRFLKSERMFLKKLNRSTIQPIVIRFQEGSGRKLGFNGLIVVRFM